MTIFVDADACPVKEDLQGRAAALARRAGRRQLLHSHANWASYPVRLVDAGADAAGDWIAGRAGRGYVVV